MLPLDWKIAVREIPADGLEIDRSATPEERERLARDLEIVEVVSLRVKGRVRPRAGGNYRLEGRLDADVVQSCVISLDPVAGHVAQDMAVELRPAETILPDDTPPPDGLIDEPDIEAIEHGEIALGRIVHEELISGLDPYPRLADVALDRTDAGAEATADHPFAKLQALKDRDGQP